jgi:hypothetical protein
MMMARDSAPVLFSGPTRLPAPLPNPPNAHLPAVTPFVVPPCSRPSDLRHLPAPSLSPPRVTSSPRRTAAAGSCCSWLTWPSHGCRRCGPRSSHPGARDVGILERRVGQRVVLDFLVQNDHSFSRTTKNN